MKFVRTIPIAMAAAAMLSLPLAMPASAQGSDCMSDRQIQSAIQSGDIQSWPSVKRMAGFGSYQEVSDVQVCHIGGRPFYIVNVVSPEGEATKIALNAIDGSRQVL